MIKSKAGFTLIEILVVVIIIGILAATALMYYGRFIERMRMTEALQLFGTVIAAQERNMLKKYRYTDIWTHLDVVPRQLPDGSVMQKYYDNPTQPKIYFTNGSGPDGDSGLGSFRPGYKVSFIKADDTPANRWFIKAERIGGGSYSEHYFLVRAFDDTKIYCIPDGEHADSVTLCMDFMGVGTPEELDPDPTASAGGLGPHDNLASAGNSGAGGSGAGPKSGGDAPSENTPGENDPDKNAPSENTPNENAPVENDPNETTPDVGGDGDNNSDNSDNFDMEDGAGENDSAGSDGANDNGGATGGNTPSENAPSGDEAASSVGGNGNAGNTGNSGNGNNGNENVGPGNNSGNGNSGNENAGSGNNSGSGSSGNSGSQNNNSGLKDLFCTITFHFFC